MPYRLSMVEFRWSSEQWLLFWQICFRAMRTNRKVFNAIRIRTRSVMLISSANHPPGGSRWELFELPHHQIMNFWFCLPTKLTDSDRPSIIFCDVSHDSTQSCFELIFKSIVFFFVAFVFGTGRVLHSHLSKQKKNSEMDNDLTKKTQKNCDIEPIQNVTSMLLMV